MCSSVSIGYFLLTGSAKGTSPYWLSPSFGVTSLRAGIAMSAPLEPFAGLNAGEIELTVVVLGKRVPAPARRACLMSPRSCRLPLGGGPSRSLGGVKPATEIAPGAVVRRHVLAVAG